MPAGPTLSPPPLDAAPSVASLRTLGSLASQAAPGDDARLGPMSFGSIAAVRSYAGTPIANAMHSTKGYYTANDGGDAMYYWDPVSTASDDGGAVIKITAIPVGRMRLLLTSTRVNVRHFGCLADGVVDDRAALRAAMLYAASDPLSIGIRVHAYAPAGKYALPYDGTSTVDTGLVVPPGCHLIGDGKETRFYNPMTNSDYVAQLLTPGHNHVMVTLADGGGQRIEGINFCGENGDEAGTGFTPPSFVRCSAVAATTGATNSLDVVIRRCHFNNLIGYSATTSGAIVAKRWSVVDCELNWVGFTLNCVSENGTQARNVMYNACGIESAGYGDGIQTVDNLLYGAYNVGISIYGRGQNCCGNIVDLSLTPTGTVFLGGAAPGIIAANLEASTIGNNVVIDPPNSGFELTTRGDLPGGRCKRVSMTGNTVKFSRNTGVGTIYGFQIQATDGLVMSGNSVRAADGSATLTYGISVFGCTDISLNGDQVEGAGTGISIDSSTNVRLSNTHTTASVQYGTYITNTTGITLAGGSSLSNGSYDLYVQPGATNYRKLGFRFGTSYELSSPTVDIDAGVMIEVVGSELTGLDQTITPGNVRTLYCARQATYAAAKTIRIAAAGAQAGDRVRIAFYDTAGILGPHAVTVVDDVSSATLWTFHTDQTTRTYRDFWFDGANWFGVAQRAFANLTALGGLTGAADKAPYFTGVGAMALADITAAGRALNAGVSAAAQRTTLGLVIGTDVQAHNAELDAIAGLTSAADKAPYFTGAGTAALADLTAAGRALNAGVSAAAQRTTLGLVIGTDVQAHAASLDTLAGAITTAGQAMAAAATAKAQAALLGGTIPTAGTNIPDADTTISISGGAHYIMPTATAARAVTVDVTGSPISGAETIIIDVTRTSAFAITIKDDTAATLVTIPASVAATVILSHDGSHFANPRVIRIQ